LRFFLYYFIFQVFLRNPLLALIIIAFAYLIIDRQFIGLLPDVFKPYRRKTRIKNLKDEVEINPANVDAYKELGLLYLEEKKYQVAVEYFLKTLNKMEEYADIHFFLGKSYYLQGQSKKGTDELEKGLEINTKVGYGEPYVYLLEAEINTDKDPEKIEDLINNLERFGTPEILYKAGKVLVKYDLQRAKLMFKEALENYKASPRNFKKLHRRWAFLSKLNLISK